MDVCIPMDEYVQIVYERSFYSIENNKLKKEIKELQDLLAKAEKIINDHKSPIVSVSSTGDISFNSKVIEDNISKEIVKDIILDTNLNGLFTRTEDIYNKAQTTFDAIKRQDGISIERSIEKDAEQQLENINKVYDTLFISDIKKNYKDLYNKISKDAANTISEFIQLNDTIEYRGIGDAIFEKYSKYKYRIKGDKSGKIYKVKGVSYSEDENHNKILSGVVIKLANTVLSAEEIVVTPDQLIPDSFRNKIDGMTKCKVIKSNK